MPCMLKIENLFKHVHEKGDSMSYTLDFHYKACIADTESLSTSILVSDGIESEGNTER